MKKIFRGSLNKNIGQTNYEVVVCENLKNEKNVLTLLNEAIRQSNGHFLILCQQDVCFPAGWLQKVKEQMALVEKMSPHWGVLGLYGIDLNFCPVGHIIDRGKRLYQGTIPCAVQSLDEVCLILKKDSGLILNEQLNSHHLYGTELCLQAYQKGLRCFVIDAPVEHISSTCGLDESFYIAVKKLRQLYKNKKVPDVICSPCAVIRMNNKLKSFLKYYQIKKIQKRNKTKQKKKSVFPVYSLFQQPDSYYSSPRFEMLRFITGSPKTTLELGCGEGLFSFEIKNKYNAETWAIEYNPQAVQRAKRFLDHVLCGDACILVDNLPDHTFDAIFCFDLLEHLVDPFALLEKLKQKLTKNGALIASIPNIRHYKTLEDLLFKGEWVYTNAGTLDITHLRFFTRKSIIRTFENLGYQIERLEGIRKSKKVALKLLSFLSAGRLEDIQYLQFAVVARPKQ